MLWGDQFVKAGNLEEAAKRYDNAILLRPADPELRMNFGSALVRLGQLDDARKHFEAALRFDPASQPAKDALAALDAKQRDNPK